MEKGNSRLMIEAEYETRATEKNINTEISIRGRSNGVRQIESSIQNTGM